MNNNKTALIVGGTGQLGFYLTNYVSKKNDSLREVNEECGIAVLFGDDPDYYETLDAWIYQGR